MSDSANKLKTCVWQFRFPKYEYGILLCSQLRKLRVIFFLATQLIAGELHTKDAHHIVAHIRVNNLSLYK